MSLTHSIWYSGGVVADRIVHGEGQSSWGFLVAAQTILGLYTLKTDAWDATEIFFKPS